MAVQLRNFHAPFHCWRTPGDNQACSRLRLYHSEGRQYDYRGSSHSDFAVLVQVVRIRQKRERGPHNRHQELAHSDQLRKDGKSVKLNRANRTILLIDPGDVWLSEMTVRLFAWGYDRVKRQHEPESLDGID